MRNRTRWASLTALGMLVAFGLAYTLIVRPWHMRWGATDQEVAMQLPGDALVRPDASVSTRAITIHAPVATAWAWLIQTGQSGTPQECSRA